MPFDSNGVFTRIHNWTDDQQNHIAIECGRHDQEDDNFAQGFNDCFCRDGRAAATGNFNLGNFKIQNLANGTASTDAVNKSQLDAQSTSLTALISTSISNTLATLYPVGSVYIGTQSSCPMASLITGSTWTLVSSGKALWTGTGSNGNTTIAAGLPNITGGFTTYGADNVTGAFKTSDSSSSGGAGGGGYYWVKDWSFDASRSSSVYGKSSTVQPPAYVVNVWRRTA
jgi:hypothetical protein